MQLVKSIFFAKSNDALNTVVKNTSCSHGWLRWVVQIIFGAITVGSFIMILLMAMQRPSPSLSRCKTFTCRVLCSELKFDQNAESDVISSAMEAGLNCERIVLTLQNFTFDNNTIPLRWMSRMPTNIHVLNIIGGNLRHIPSTAFVGQFAGNIRALMLQDIIISQWMSTTFVGLSSLRSLLIKNCVFGNIARNALGAIDNTIHTLTVINSGKWCPTSITGDSSSDNILDTVDFSFNDFGSILDSNSFQGLKSCKILYLNNCKITAIGAGAFDPLVNIDQIFLSDNLLHTLTPGLFGPFLLKNRPKPRIHLENNPWICDCSQKDLIQMSKSGLLPVDTFCMSPPHMVGKTVTDLEEYCLTSSQSIVGLDIVVLDEKEGSAKGSPLSSFSQPCLYGAEPLLNTTLKLVSPVTLFGCNNNSFIYDFSKALRTALPKRDLTESNWLKPTFVLHKSKYSVIQVSSTVKNYGLLWYQTSCPNEVYCLNTIPKILRVYNTVPDTKYTFCPFDLRTHSIPLHECIDYNLSETTDTQNVMYKYLNKPPFFYIGVSILCIGLGAICVFMIIRKNPILLKGSKRLLFVKHRNVDALVMPPKIPLRQNNSLIEDNIRSINDNIFTVTSDGIFCDNNFMRSSSFRSDKSNSPTYISAVQPTEDQLAEWRIRHHFDKSPSIISMSSGISTLSWTND